MAKSKIVDSPMKDLKPQSWLGKGLYVIGGISLGSYVFNKVKGMISKPATP